MEESEIDFSLKNQVEIIISALKQEYETLTPVIMNKKDERTERKEKENERLGRNEKDENDGEKERSKINEIKTRLKQRTIKSVILDFISLKQNDHKNNDDDNDYNNRAGCYRSVIQ